MGLKDSWKKLTDYIGGGNEEEFETDEYEDDEEMEESQPRRQPASSRRPAVAASLQPGQQLKMMMMIVEPETFDDSQSIANYLRERKPVVINFESTPQDVSKRVVDFISGATYALDGNIQKVGNDIFLCVPSNVTVDRSKHEYAPLQWNNNGEEK